MDKTYTDGLNDAWELARKLYEMKSKEFDEVFKNVHYVDVFYCYTPQEALAKLETYEKLKEINVGDVVELADGTKAVVMDRFDDEVFALFTENGCVQNLNIKSNFKKTNKHIDITSVFEQLKGE